jgi:glucose 1-dehydrogenase
MSDADRDPFRFPSPGLKGLDGKTAIITGSTRGIGRGIAQRYAVEGMNVIVTGRSVSDGEQVAQRIRDEGYEATYVHADLADPDDIEALVSETVTEYGRIDIIVNNAAAWRHGSVADRSLEDWELVMNVSLRAPWYLSMVALDHMPEGGSVINVSSVHSRATDPARFPYNVAKSGLNGLTRVQAIDLAPHGVRANGLVVGNVRKEYNDADPYDQSHYYARLVPANRRGTPLDVAGIALFLASDEAEFITGTNIPVDGGRLTCAAKGDWPPDKETTEDATHTYYDRIPDG